MTDQPRITLKSLKVADFASQETLCFTASVLFDGKRIGHANNDGHGGCAFVTPLKGDYALLKAAEAYAASLPPEKVGNGENAWEMAVTLDGLVDDLALVMHHQKKVQSDFKRHIRKKVMFIKEGKLYFLKSVNPVQTEQNGNAERLYRRILATNGADTVIINTLPEQQAFDAYYAAVTG